MSRRSGLDSGLEVFEGLSPLIDLVQAFKQLPGVGPKSAQRLAYHVLLNDRQAALELGQSLIRAIQEVRHCSLCNNFSHGEVCSICTDSRRDASLLCVVETPADLAAIEMTHTYKGHFYVLMGKASPLDGVHPDTLDWPRLAARIQDPELQEVILATNFTTEGEATSVFLTERIRRMGKRVSRLARGVPLGGELEYTDPTTVARALMDRRQISNDI